MTNYTEWGYKDSKLQRKWQDSPLLLFQDITGILGHTTIDYNASLKEIPVELIAKIKDPPLKKFAPVWFIQHQLRSV